MEDLCNRLLLNERIKLEPQYLNQDFKDEILSRLKQKVEGICTKHGYIKKGSIEIYKMSPGCVEIVSLNGNTIYNVAFYAEVCNPLLGSIIRNAKVVNLNRFGILAEARLQEDKYSNSVLEIIIAKNSVNIVSEVDLDSIKIGDDVLVEVIGKKFNLGDKKISVIGKIIRDIKKEPRYVSKALASPDDEEEEVEEPDAEVLEGEEEDVVGEEAEDGEEAENEEEDVEDEEEEEEDEDAKVGGDFFSDEEDDFDEAFVDNGDDESDLASDEIIED
jgi:DNA-directed RNA polymerase subunit E'/Rpb7